MAPKAVLIGLPGSGKSTIGRRLAKALGLTMFDTDVAIEERTGRSIAEIFTAEGEAGFRRIEEEVIRDALQTHDGILSLGGGAVTTPGVRDALSGHTVVYLEISEEEGVRRTSAGAEVPGDHERAGSAVPPGGHHPGEHQPAQPGGSGAPHRLPPGEPAAAPAAHTVAPARH